MMGRCLGCSLLGKGDLGGKVPAGECERERVEGGKREEYAA